MRINLIFPLIISCIFFLSCSGNGDSNNDNSNSTTNFIGKWYLYQEGYQINGNEVLELYSLNTPGCEKTYYQFFDNKTWKYNEFQQDCYNYVESGTYTKTDKILNFGGTDEWQIVTETSNILKIKQTNGSGIEIEVLKK
jgi:hypothetical protein